MRKTDDLKCISRVLLLNDKRAFEQLVEKYQSPLRRYLLSLTGNKELSNDIAQEAFIKAYFNLGSFKGIAGFQTWLYRIAYNLWFDHIRSNKNAESADILLSLSDKTKNADVSIDLHEALKALKAEEKSIITLFYMEDISVKEISKIMHLSEGTIKSHLSRGREKLKKQLNDYQV